MCDAFGKYHSWGSRILDIQIGYTQTWRITKFTDMIDSNFKNMGWTSV